MLKRTILIAFHVSLVYGFPKSFRVGQELQSLLFLRESVRDHDSSSRSGKIAVIGATGRLGTEAVRNLSSKGVKTRCMIRSDSPPANLATLPNVEFVKGDVVDYQSVKELLQGCSACLALYGATRKTKVTDILPWVDPEMDPTHPKNVNYYGVRNIIEACRTSEECKRIVRITGKGETPSSFFSILINSLGSFAKAWNYEGEVLLRNCKDVDYTIIRPGAMKLEMPLTGAKVLALADNGGDLKVSAIPYVTIADLCVQVLEYPNTARATLCAMTVPDGEGEETYGPLLLKVEPDTRVFPSSLLQEHIRAVRKGAVISSAVISIIVFSVLYWTMGWLQ